MVKYVISTEDKPNLKKIVAKHFSSFRITKGLGYWQGKQEVSAQIEVVVSKGLDYLIRLLAQEIKTTNRQESVLVERYDVVEELI